jgi:hypothetical protein
MASETMSEEAELDFSGLRSDEVSLRDHMPMKGIERRVLRWRD